MGIKKLISTEKEKRNPVVVLKKLIKLLKNKGFLTSEEIESLK